MVVVVGKGVTEAAFNCWEHPVVLSYVFVESFNRNASHEGCIDLIDPAEDIILLGIGMETMGFSRATVGRELVTLGLVRGEG